MLAKGLVQELIAAKEITIFPYAEENFGTVSYDLRLGSVFQRVKPLDGKAFDGMKPKDRVLETLEVTEYLLKPGESIIGKTEERVGIHSTDVSALFDGKASLSILGLFTHVSSMLIDPGFVGELTVEIHNSGEYPILLKPGMKIGQVIFFSVEE